MIKVTMDDVYAAHGCARGALAFMRRHGLDYRAFFSVGLPVEQVEATGDAMAIKIAEVARGRQQ